jgi:hypothetical protein
MRGAEALAMTEYAGRWGRIALLATLVLPVALGCRRGQELPAVPGATKVLPFSAVMMFRETPVSSREFDSADRRWTSPTTPRFDGGRLRSYPGEDGGTVVVEAPPKMAFKNRSNDCGSVNDRRVCVLPWEQAELTLCGRPLDGHLEMNNEHLADATLFACRVLTPAHASEDGGWVYAERDCTQAQRVPLRKLHPQDFTFRVGDFALVADPGGDFDRKVCERLATQLAGPGGARDAAQKPVQP